MPDPQKVVNYLLGWTNLLPTAWRHFVLGLLTVVVLVVAQQFINVTDLPTLRLAIDGAIFAGVQAAARFITKTPGT